MTHHCLAGLRHFAEVFVNSSSHLVHAVSALGPLSARPLPQRFFLSQKDRFDVVEVLDGVAGPRVREDVLVAVG